jgi:hypothetical protein
MPLIDCSECGRQISTEAEFCPQCGHPNRPRSQAAAGPICYACSAPATTKCQACGALSCAQHLESIYVSHGRGGANELRCKDCYSSARVWQIVGIIIFVIFAIGLFCWWQAQQKEFDQKWKGGGFPKLEKLRAIEESQWTIASGSSGFGRSFSN